MGHVRHEVKITIMFALASFRAKALCVYTNPTHGEKRVCIKPPSGECSRITWQEHVEAKFKPWDDKYFAKNYNYAIPMS